MTERAMRHPAPEHGLARKLLVEMHRIHVAGGLAEQLDVALGDGVFRAGGHARLQFVEINAVIAASPGQFAGCAAGSRPKAGEQGCQMVGSIGLNLLAMNPIGDEQGLDACGIGALDVGQKPVAHRQRPRGLCPSMAPVRPGLI